MTVGGEKEPETAAYTVYNDDMTWWFDHQNVNDTGRETGYCHNIADAIAIFPSQSPTVGEISLFLRNSS